MKINTFISHSIRWVLLLVVLMGIVLPGPTYALSNPQLGTITVTPTSGAPGSKALVMGSFSAFGAYDSVVVWWGSISDGRRLGSASLRSDGSFAIQITIPPEASPGLHQILADVNYGYDQASTDITVTNPNRSAAYIYDNDLTTANNFKNLLDSNGVNTTLIQIDNVAGASLYPYDLILVGSDSGYTGQWGTQLAVDRLRQSGKPVLGIGEGGYALFGKLNLDIGYPHGSHGFEIGMEVVDPALPCFNTPYDIPIPPVSSLTLYNNSSNTVQINVQSPPNDVTLIGREIGAQTHYVLLAQGGRYLLWGMDGPPSSMTTIGQDLFVNAVWTLVLAMEIDTLILTDYQRMEDLGYDHASVVALESDINHLVGLTSSTTNMSAILRDLSDHAPINVQTAFTAWEGNEGDVTATNTYVEAIDAYIENLKQSAYLNLYYLIIVGTTEVIPMKAREQDHLYSSQERLWGAGLPGPDSYIHQLYSTPGPINGWGHYLTDSIYGDLSYMADGWGTDHELVPELAVGRLVETPAQISDLVDTYISNSGRFSRSDRVSLASDDYVDSGTLAATYMDPGADAALVQCDYDSNDAPPKLNTSNDLVYFGGHGNYNVISTGLGDAFMAGDHATRGDTAALGDMPDAVIVTSGCHNGASFGNQLYHAPDPTNTTYSEFPEAFAERKVGVYIGATGFTAVSISGCEAGAANVRHNEKLSTYIIKHLDQDGYITAGEAFRRAVNSYVTDVGSIGTVERRVISITTLYGIPNYLPEVILAPTPPWWLEYWLEPVWLDPPPYIDPDEFRFSIELKIHEWEIRHPFAGFEWYLEIPGAEYGGSPTQPSVPVFKADVVLPLGSTITSVEWDQMASESTTWFANGPMYIPSAGDGTGEGMTQAEFSSPGRWPSQPHTAYATTTAGGSGTLAGLSIIPLQHNPQTLETTLWTTLAFTVTSQAGPSTDADGDGLPTYWESSTGLSPNDDAGEHGASGDPDNDNLSNIQEFGLGTDPQDRDTDDDGWGDGFEITLQTNPLNPGSKPLATYMPISVKSYP
jgi:hypothetical protein